MVVTMWAFESHDQESRRSRNHCWVTEIVHLIGRLKSVNASLFSS